MTYKKRPFNPQLNVPYNTTGRLCGRTAKDVVDAALAIKSEKWKEKNQRKDDREKAKQKVAVAAVSLAVMPWD